ncbi:LOW QUALITY PROTEIN: signal recognition particle subunit SRP72-like [Penaeus chinensis]|uniref:LOW QUALITY PROTEIN: signal recognition particle subunit SRP72-like n=1 Tax=Penaeus chinensis TaxID=139456 RepID=UPI001FB63F72|nr:LOW QUALITY PROTEIN: signal recognition particle subunit SRP72-like [Penaeus chinensis]
MATTKESRMSSYFSELKKFIDNGNNVKVVKCANKILSEAPEDLKAWQCKVVALIQMDQFSEVLSIVSKSKIVEDLAFEKAYCEYRLNKVMEAYKTISKAKEVSPRIQELHAQVLYRLERYEECYDIYREMIRTNSDDFDQERLTNMAAVAVNRYIEGSSKDPAVNIDDSSYEVLYNGACHLLATGNYDEALKRLKEAEGLCRTYLIQEDGATEEEVADEVAIIRVQQGHCLQLMGQEQEALAIYNSVLKSKPEDPALLAIINNNLVTINRGGNVFDSRKKMKTALAPGLEHKLTSYQRASIAFNHCLLAFSTNQDELCRTEVAKLANDYPKFRQKASIIQSALLGREGKLEAASATLQKCAQEDQNEALGINLMAIQILLAGGDKRGACKILKSLDEKNRYRQGIVSALVSLYLSLEDRDGASTILREAVDWHKKNKTSGVHLSELWRHAADFHLRGGDAPTAAASLQELQKLKPKDVMTLAQLITAYAQYDVEAAQKLSKQLPPASSVVHNVDGDVLEASLGHRYMKKLQQGKGDLSPASPSSPTAKVTPGAELKKKTKKKKKRKIRLPKNYNPDVPPDPERWLPRWQRKTFRKKRDRRGKDVMKGTQGVSSDAADKYDITKTAGTSKPSQAASPKPENVGLRRNFQKKKGGGKKKKGGW